MEVNQDPTILEEVVLEDMEVQEEEETPETIEGVEENAMMERAIETATADVVDGKTVKLKDPNFLIISR